MKRAMGTLGVGSKTKAADVLQWMEARRLVEGGGNSYKLTARGIHVTDRACTVMARRSRR